MKLTSAATLQPSNIIDKLYDIAIDPETLDAFVEAWNDADLDNRAARKAIEKIDQFDATYAAHLQRAEAFLSRAQTQEAKPDFHDMLARFDSEYRGGACLWP